MANFKDLLKAWAIDSAWIDDNDRPNSYTSTLYSLGQAVAHSVLKKIIKSTADKTIANIKCQISATAKDLDRMTYASAHSEHLVIDENGDYKTVVDDKVLDKAVSDLVKKSMGDFDLVHDAIVAILDETKAQRERESKKPIDLERPYEIRRLKRKVYIQSFDSVDGWETVTVTPIQQIFKAVRRCIMENKSILNNGVYTYLQDLVTDDDGKEETIYKRLPKYSDLGGHVCDFNGVETVYTVSPEMVDNTSKLVERLNLTTRQMQVLTLRQRGYGYKAIGTYLGIRPDSIRDCLKAIQAKAIKIGFTPIQTDKR